MGIRVCLIARTFAPAFSGAAIRFGQYIPGLAERNVDMYVLTGTPSDSKRSFAETPHHGEDDGTPLSIEWTDQCEIHRVRLPAGNGRRRQLAFNRAIVRHAERHSPDVIQLIDLPPAMAGAVSRIRTAGVGTVFSATQMYGLSPNVLRRAVQRYRRRKAIEQVDQVVVSSTKMRGYVESLGVSKRIHVIPNGVDVKRFRPPASLDERKELRNRFGIEQTAELLLFVGSIKHRKGVDLLVEAFRHVAAERPRAQLWLIGPREDLVNPREYEFSQRLERLVAACGVSDRLRFLGLKGEIELYMRAADLLLFPSYREGMGNVVLEAMASGLPVILTPYLGLPDEIGTSGKHYVLASSEPVELARAMSRLLQSADERERIGRAAREWTTEQLNMEGVLDKYTRVYEVVCTAQSS